MAVEKVRIDGDNGRFKEADCCWYVMNPKQQFIVVGIDDPACVDLMESSPGVEAHRLGRLTEQNPIFEQQIVNSLRNDEWDFETYPDTEIILLTDNR